VKPECANGFNIEDYFTTQPADSGKSPEGWDYQKYGKYPSEKRVLKENAAKKFVQSVPQECQKEIEDSLAQVARAATSVNPLKDLAGLKQTPFSAIAIQGY